MKPRPRVRKAIRWGGLVLTPLLALVWVSSKWWMAVRPNPGIMHVSMGGGTVSFGHIPVHGNEGWQHRRFHYMSGERPWNWWFSIISTSDRWVLIVPLWPLVLLSGAVTIRAWRLDAVAQRRKRTGACLTCGYDLAGVAGACPECGTAAPDSRPAPP